MVRISIPSEDDYWEMVHEIDENGHGMTEWEVYFIGDLVDNEEAIRVCGLSARQMRSIEKIHEERL